MNWPNNFLYRIKKSNAYYSILLLISLALISSCIKDVLEKVPTDRFSDEAVWGDENLITAFVNNTYREMPTGNKNAWNGLWGAADETYRGSGANNFISQGNITPSQLGLLNYWTSTASGFHYWGVITRCNIFFSKIDEVEVDPIIKNRMIGTMKFFRAFAYFRLVAFYGGVPLITEPFGLTDDFEVPRNTYDECMDFVIREFDAAADLLPLTYPNTDLGHITKGAVLATKSRALLYMASPLNNPANDQTKWQKAADAAKAVIDLNLYSLFPNYKDLFLKENSYNSEAIWSRPYNHSVSSEYIGNELGLYPNGYGGWANDAAPYHNLVDRFELVSGLLPEDDPTYDPQNPYVNRDPRFYATILYDGALFKGREVEHHLPGGLDSREGPVESWNASQTGYAIRKFINEAITYPGPNNQGDSPWLFFRYAEILLNYAEAMYMLGDEETCRDYINKIRSRPGVDMPPVTDTGAALLTRLQRERQIELVFEEHRYFDVRRWKIAPEELNKTPLRMDVWQDPATGIKTYTVAEMGQFTFVFNERNYLVPIPQSEIDKNPLLVQNPGY